MAMIYLKHPKHGMKQTNVEAEAKYDEEHGWVRFDPFVPVMPDLPPPMTVNEMKRGPGRPRREP
jgi:hypothetical protein